MLGASISSVVRVVSCSPTTCAAWLASNGCRPLTKSRVNENGPIPGEPHAILGLLFGRRADAERKAPPKGGLGGHGLLRQADRDAARTAAPQRCQTL